MHIVPQVPNSGERAGLHFTALPLITMAHSQIGDQ
jgi:hypothetical protein